MNWLNLSIRLKILLLLIGLCVVSLGVYAWLALNSFQEDKIAYVYESTLAHARATSNQMDSELRIVVDQINSLMQSSAGGTKFSPEQKQAFKGQKLLKHVQIMKFKDDAKKYFLIDQAGEDVSKSLTEAIEKKLIVEALQSSMAFYVAEEAEPVFFIALRFNITGNKPTIVIATLERLNFLDAFYSSGLQNTYLISGEKNIVLRPFDAKYKISQHQLERLIERLKDAPNAPFSTFQVDDLLSSYAKVNLGSLKVVSLIPKSDAIEPVRRLVLKSIGLLIVVVGIAILISLLMSNRLTSDIKKLFEATQLLSRGDFKTRVKIASRDEIGVLADGFNQMAGQIEVLLGEAAVKARMETELKTAQMVQAKLFPSPTYDGKKVKLHGFFQPASECGGDWWYHFELAGKIFILVGDATGHGVGPALVTSSAKSVASVLEDRKDVTVPEIVDMLNNVIHKTGKGEIVMTFAVFSIDEVTGEVHYCSASHEPSIVFHAEGEAYSKDHVDYLMDSDGPRIGEALKSQYTFAKTQLKAKDRLVIFTDGVYDLQKDGQKFGERRWLKALEEKFNVHPQDIHAAALDVDQLLSDYQDDIELLDDVTYVVVQYG